MCNKEFASRLYVLRVDPSLTKMELTDEQKVQVCEKKTLPELLQWMVENDCEFIEFRDILLHTYTYNDHSPISNGLFESFLEFVRSGAKKITNPGCFHIIISDNEGRSWYIEGSPGANYMLYSIKKLKAKPIEEFLKREKQS